MHASPQDKFTLMHIEMYPGKAFALQKAKLLSSKQELPY